MQVRRRMRITRERGERTEEGYRRVTVTQPLKGHRLTFTAPPRQGNMPVRVQYCRPPQQKRAGGKAEMLIALRKELKISRVG